MKKSGWILIVGICMSAGLVLGAGFQLYTEGSAEALGQAAAVGGRTNLVSLAWYNPAALAGFQQTATMAGFVFVRINSDFKGVAGDAAMADDWRTIPHFYYIQPLASEWTAMLSVNMPYGLITEWPNDWAGGIAAIYSRFSSIYTTPSLAWRINDKASISAGFNVVYGDARLTASRDFTAYGGPDFGNRTVKGDDVGYGYTASVHVNVAKGWSVGARYQSRVKLKLQGDSTLQNNPIPPGDTTYDGRAEVVLPSTLNIGVANNPIEKLRLDLDLVWTEWSTYDELVYQFGSGYPVTPVTPNPEVNPKRWDDVWSVRIGGEYELNDDWVLRAGYGWDPTPLPDSTRAPELPDGDRHMLTTGMGWKRNGWGIDVAYAYIWSEKVRTGSEVVDKVPRSAGTYETATHIIGLSGSYTF